MEHKKIVDCSYHYGLKVRIYPSQQQKEMIDAMRMRHVVRLQ